MTRVRERGAPPFACLLYTTRSHGNAPHASQHRQHARALPRPYSTPPPPSRPHMHTSGPHSVHVPLLALQASGSTSFKTPPPPSLPPVPDNSALASSHRESADGTPLLLPLPSMPRGTVGTAVVPGGAGTAAEMSVGAVNFADGSTYSGTLKVCLVRRACAGVCGSANFRVSVAWQWQPLMHLTNASAAGRSSRWPGNMFLGRW